MRIATGIALRGVWLAAIALAGCEGVPVLILVDGAGSPDAMAEPDDAGGVGPPEAGCPGPNPPTGASVCCGSVPCNGNCAGRCPECEATCTAPGTFCCAKGTILCRPLGAVCK